ncbi:Putative pyruvate, phosphate dikinase regulatory protein [Aurantiacibacter atlanticus]|uniref:Putative pyruvate, phosphate dikinase regulatory protein n=2 Tax=Aurantiacibacter atlanticus TaxID=1648404 RepID=A0A0H4VVN5_9SPHN|nr:Putative pyruvate, phosphate dikinase regulatory protein [Aurantiacibacter atlanticus]
MTLLAKRPAAGMQFNHHLVSQSLPWFMRKSIHMTKLNLHLLSDSTGETLEMIAKAALAQFEDSDVTRHFWPMVRSQQHLERIVDEFKSKPGLVLYTLVNEEIRQRLEERCTALGLKHVDALDAVTEALEERLGQEAKGRPGRQHAMDEAYFARVDAIQFTIAHDDGIGWDNWEGADIILAGVSRTSKTPTSIYLANRGYKVANIPLVVESPPPKSLFDLRQPMVVGLTTAPERLVQIRRNRLLSLNESTETSYVDGERVTKEVAFARRLFADNGWPVIDVTRRSIEETAAAVIRLYQEREARDRPAQRGTKPI